MPRCRACLFGWFVFASTSSATVMAASVTASRFGASQVERAEVEQGFGVYSDNHERSRQRLSLTADVALQHSAYVGSSTCRLSGTRDRVYEPVEPSSGAKQTQQNAGEVNQEYLGSTVSLNTSQTLDKLIELRQSYSVSQSPSDTAHAVGLGASRWFHAETVRLSLDTSQQQAHKPAIEFLDYDQEIVHVPARTSSRSVDVGVRHLATAKTIIDYQAGWTGASNRPDAWRYGAGLRQYVPALDGAIHTKAMRYRNYGTVSTETTYGVLDAWEAEWAWVQSLWRDAEALLSYRYYREDETTRALGDELTFGSDTISVGFSQRLSRQNTQRRSTHDWRWTMKGSRYQANNNVGSKLYATNLRAQVLEMGLSTMF